MSVAAFLKCALHTQISPEVSVTEYHTDTFASCFFTHVKKTFSITRVYSDLNTNTIAGNCNKNILYNFMTV